MLRRNQTQGTVLANGEIISPMWDAERPLFAIRLGKGGVFCPFMIKAAPRDGVVGLDGVGKELIVKSSSFLEKSQSPLLLKHLHAVLKDCRSWSS